MTESFEGLSNVVKIVDDNAVFSRNITEHIVHVRSFLQCCREKGIHLNENKFNFAKEELEFAGVVLSKEGYRMQDKIVKAIQEFPKPSNISELRSFQGMAEQLSKHNIRVTEAMTPLRPLLKKGTVFQFDEEMERGFVKAKEILSSQETLAFYRPGAKMQLHTDAANKFGLGFALQQLQPDGFYKPIQVGSRVLQAAEKNYAPIELELCGLVWAVSQCKTFLIGADQFLVFTDHKPLIGIWNNKRLDGYKTEE